MVSFTRFLKFLAPQITLLERYKGCVVGLACGDALGAPLESMVRGTFAPLTGIVDRVSRYGVLVPGVHRLRKGEWTDDTSMFLCLAFSLLEKDGFDPVDQLSKYLRWSQSCPQTEDYMTSNGRCFDIGDTVGRALRTFEASVTKGTPEPYCGSCDENTAGNGSLMRVAALPLYYFFDPVQAIDKAALSSKTTHKDRRAIDACRYMTALLVGALQGAPKDELLSVRYSPVPGLWEKEPLEKEIDAVACGSFKEKDLSLISGSGYVVRSLEAALWAFYSSDSFKDGCLRAVNLGNDADTTGAVYGQLAGAYYGIRDIPRSWLQCLAKSDFIVQTAKRLFEAARAHSSDRV